MTEANGVDVLVPEAEARRELGGLSAMSFWRYDHYPEKAPPGWAPAIKIGSRNYRSRRMLEAVKANLVKAAQERSKARAPATAEAA